MTPVTLYQFALCPYCHKVRAGLEAKGIVYRTVEVNPMNKRGLPPLPEGAPRKVPVLDWGGEVIFDSTVILKALDQKAPGGVRLLPESAAALARTEEVEDWVDDALTFALPTVIYGTWKEAFNAAQVTARTSNFGPVQNLMVRAGGSLIMHQVVKRILKKHNETDAHAWVAREIDRFEAWLGEQPFVCGASPSLGDIATHGALSCIADFPIYAELMKRPRLAAWFERVRALRAIPAIEMHRD
jgi:glutathione S-transferase